MFTLRVVQIKNAYSVFGYVNSNTFEKINSNKLETVLLLGSNNVYINLKTDDDLDDDYIGLSSHTRKMCSYCLESKENFTYIDKPSDFPNLLEKVLFVISPINTSIEIKPINCEELTEKIKGVMMQGCINKNQILGIGSLGIKISIDNFIFYEDDNVLDRTNGLIYPVTEFEFSSLNVKLTNKKSSSNNQIFSTNFDFRELDIGGMNQELSTILRRVFMSRMLPSDIVEKLNIVHVKGLIMFGPPGTGKTLIARQLSKCLKAKSIKIINGPELLTKYVGETERKFRELFLEAESDSKTGQEGLHVIIFDEFDSVVPKRGSLEGVSGDINNKVVTQLLSKIDGVDSLNNVLLIGMTNRLDQIDPAILRPGRFEVHVEINLPDESGREEILIIHTKHLYKEQCVSSDVDLKLIANLTKNYTGAELEGLVREARSYAINEIVDLKDLSKKIELSNIMIRMEHFILGIKNYTPKFGLSVDSLDYYLQHGITDYSEEFVRTKKLACDFIDGFKKNKNKVLGVIGVTGETKTGKTAFSAWLAKYCEFPYVKIISNNDVAGFSEFGKNQYIKEAFDQGYLSELSVIMIDSVDTLIEYYRDDISGSLRFMNSVYNVIKTYIKKNPTKPQHKTLIIFNTESMSGFDFDKYSDLSVIMECAEISGVKVPIKNMY